MAKEYEIVFSDGAHFVVTAEEASILVDRLSQATSGDRNKKIESDSARVNKADFNSAVGHASRVPKLQRSITINANE